MTGHVLKKARHESGLTQKEVADRLGVSQPYLALLERGKRPVTAPLARKAVRKLNVRPTLVPCAQKFRPGPRRPILLQGSLVLLGTLGTAT